MEWGGRVGEVVGEETEEDVDEGFVEVTWPSTIQTPCLLMQQVLLFDPQQ
jgi:hypothetical protein